jgi:hypothetical protein
LCLQLELWDYWWDHNVIMGLWYIVMVRVMSPKVRWSDCCLRATRTRTHPQTNTLGHVRFSSEIPGKILRKIRGNLSMEVLADGRISKWAVFHGSVSLESIEWNLWSTDCWFFRLVCLLPGGGSSTRSTGWFSQWMSKETNSRYVQVSYVLPFGKLWHNLHNYGTSPFLVGKSTISMAIFNSYVKLPEGT